MLNNLFKDKLQMIVNDDLLIQAIRAVFEERIEKEKPKISEVIDNEALGQIYRAYEMAKLMIDEGFIDLMSYKLPTKPFKIFNKER